jgi:uncharacterized protein (DUF1501 family)
MATNTKDNVLVVLQLSGGNDALNTVIPYSDLGFDIACEPTRSGPRMQGYLVNDLCETITANKKQSDFALAA